MTKRADLTRPHGFNGGGVSICVCLDEDASCHELARPESLSVVFKPGFKSEKFSIRVGLDAHEKQLAAGERAIVLFLVLSDGKGFSSLAMIYWRRSKNGCCGRVKRMETGAIYLMTTRPVLA